MTTEPMAQNRRLSYVWEFPVRLSHWVNVAAMLTLAVSGYYIGAPFLASPASTSAYVMASMRLAHAIAAVFLGLSFVLRVYWIIVGNVYTNFRGLLPLTRRRWQDFGRQIQYYLFLSNKRPAYVGHNPVAGLTYVALYVLVFLQGLTGLALYAEYDPGGFWWTFFGWVFHWIAPNNVLRLIHHSLMWVFIIFFVVHLYLAILNDLTEKGGLISSIVTGYKALSDEEHEHE